MTTGKALNGKPYAGNPHVRFDEGEVAPAATPRRGSLLYKKIISLAICAIAAFSATATTYYVDKENGSDDNDGKASDRAFATAEKGFKAVHNKDTANLELVDRKSTRLNSSHLP